VLPQERTVVGVPDHLTPIIDRGRLAVGLSGEDTEVGHDPVLPDEGVVPAGSGGAGTDDLATVVDRDGPAICAAEGAQIGHHSSLPQERVGAS
jgi:hypothetical protein